MFAIVGVAMVESARNGKTASLPEVSLEDRGNDEETCIALVALHIEIVKIVHLEFRLLIAYPREDAEILDVQVEAPPVAKLKMGLRLEAESTTHIVVALQHIKIVALGTTQQNGIKEQALFPTGHKSNRRCSQLDTNPF